MKQKLLWKIQTLWEQYYQGAESHQLPLFTATSKYGFHTVEKFDFKESDDVVFSDDHGEYRGLKQQQVMEHQGKLIFLCDNHNKMLVPMFQLYQELKRPLNILHIDAHRDDALFEDGKPEVFDEENLQKLLTKSRISDFYDALSETGVIGKLDRVTDSVSFEEDYSEKDIDLLSLDIDIFGPEGDFVGTEEKIKAIAQVWKQASVICIAISPGFIDQNFAREVIQILC
jgi:hypothetical protein